MSHRTFAIALLAFVAMIFVACGGGGGKKAAPDATGEKTIPYEVLKKENRRADGKLVMEILVSETASQEQVMKLAESLQREHAGKYAYINIFDSREAWQRRADESSSDKEFWQHYLVQIAGAEMGWDDGREIHWVAKGRQAQGEKEQQEAEAKKRKDQQEAEAKKRAEEEERARLAREAETAAKKKAAEDAERAASSKLKLAKTLLEDGKKAEAIEYCEDIMKRWPDTKAAAEAKGLLGELKK